MIYDHDMTDHDMTDAVTYVGSSWHGRDYFTMREKNQIFFIQNFSDTNFQILLYF